MYKKPRNAKSQAKEGTKIINVPKQSRQIEEQDEEFFDGDDIGDFSFLKKLDVTELAKRVQKEKVQREEKPVKVKSTVHRNDSEDDEYSDEEDLSEALSDVLDSGEVEVRDWEEEQEYEQKPRVGDSQWRKKESTKLPVRTRNGNLLHVDASASESESDEGSEESDSDSETDAKEGQGESIDEDEIKVGPEAVIDAKEALARLAEEIIEAPEEKVSIYLI